MQAPTADPAVRALASLYDGSLCPRFRGAPPRLAVVGAGLAGLAAAHLLKAAGGDPQLYEASDRTGGRIRTDFGALEPGIICEWGGEFIDSTHHDMLALAACCGLTLIDTQAPAETELRPAYFFGGQHYGEADILAAYAPVASRIAADAARLSPDISWEHHADVDLKFDRMSIAEYLQGLEMAPWLRSLLRVAYETEYGLDSGVQSSINLISLIGTDPGAGFELFGRSDERYKVAEGLERITGRLAGGLAPQLHPRHRLVRLQAQGPAVQLTFDTDSGSRVVTADAVVLALPFTLLRGVELDGLLPSVQQACVQTLGYGQNAKLSVGLDSRPWREQGYDGGLFSDLPMQSGWDGSRLRPGGRGVYTWFLGGSPSMGLGHGGVEAHAARLSAAMDGIYRGFSSRRTGTARLLHWPTEPYALGSYSCYRTGQWTTLHGLQGRAAGALHFAGEHCSLAFQGYMNGAAETGRRAALAIIDRS